MQSIKRDRNLVLTTKMNTNKLTLDSDVSNSGKVQIIL